MFLDEDTHFEVILIGAHSVFNIDLDYYKCQNMYRVSTLKENLYIKSSDLKNIFHYFLVLYINDTDYENLFQFLASYN